MLIIVRRSRLRHLGRPQSNALLGSYVKRSFWGFNYYKTPQAPFS
jgi:hypothetical protein